MSSLAHFLAPLAMLFPLTAGNFAQGDSAQQGGWPDARVLAASIPAGPPIADDALAAGAFSQLLADDAWQQMRVEQRMIIRIAPRGPGQMFAMPPGPPQLPRFYERKTDKCLPIASIAGVQIESPDRLLLVTRNRKLIGASLDKTCRARDFYQGFYVERSTDGQLCAGRDTIHSRAGANCAVTRLRELVPDDD
ncbi:hypothetical protein OVA07_15800 [Novosphingobium sp. SL115]|uniref:hypothetical protein n=1 Tax=Novosphingobium sp. SL115 TaxID=2995150 RepID=UPI002272E48F|nr:hypothetical protein [Novosphingobium sp. SL115]MCY1672467.1 hypothetical protein [Novosphingobium sp. SL115]